MPKYRRAKLPGGTYFFTLVTYQRRNILLQEEIRAALRYAIRTTQARLPFSIDAWVLLPDHLHAIWVLPRNDGDYSNRWSMIKRLVTQRVVGCCDAVGAHGTPYCTASRVRRQEGGLWQRRFWEHLIRDEIDLNRCRDYLHWNPVKHGHVSRVADWPYSTFHRYVRDGRYQKDWGGGSVNDLDGEIFGE